MATLTYDFDIVGMSKVAAALASNERLFAQHSTRIDRLVNRNSGGRLGSQRSTQSRGSAYGGDQDARRRQREIDQITRSQSALGKQRMREEREFSRVASQGARDRQRAIDAQSRSQASLSRQREREERISHNTTRQIIAERRRFVEGTIGRGAGRVINGLTAVGTAGAAMVGIGGAALAASAVQQAMSLDETSRRLAIQGRNKGEAGMDADSLRRQFTQTGIATGVAPEKVAAAVTAYVGETGDLGTAMANQANWATAAQAFGSDPLEMARMAAHMRKLGVTNDADSKRAFAMLGGQGKRGSFELKDMASEFPEILSQAASFGVRGLGGLEQLGGLMQLAKSATGSGAEASTAVQTMFRQLSAKAPDIQNGDAFNGRRVEVFEGGDSRKGIKNFRNLLGDVLVASQGSLPELQKVFDVRGIKAVTPMISAFRDSRAAALKGGATEKAADEAGRTAALSLLDNASKSDMDWGEVQRDANDAMKSMSVQLEMLNNKLKEAIASELFPAVSALVPQLVALVPTVAALTKMFVDLVSWLAANPFSGLAIAFAASFAYELAKARIGSVFSAVLSAVLKPRGGGTGGGLGGSVDGGPGASGGRGGGFTLGGALGAGATGVAVGLGVAASIYAGGVMDYNQREASMNQQGDTLAAVRNMNSVGDVDAARQAVREQRRKVAELENTSFFDSISEGAYHLFSGGDKTQREVELATAKDFLGEEEGQLRKLEELKDAAERIKAAGLSFEESSKRLNDAAEKLGLKLNRGDGPSSPVKS